MPGKGILFLLVLTQACSFENNDKKKIKICFDNYKAAILTRNGQKGIECVDSASLEYYRTVLTKAIHFDSTQIENEAAIDKFTILNIRQNFSSDSILNMTNKTVLQGLINKGKAGNANIDRFDLGDITINKDVATVKKVIDGSLAPFVYTFHKEQGLWKLSMFSNSEHELYNLGIKHSILKSKLPEDEYILNVIEKSSGSSLKKNIWHPLIVN